MDNSLEHLTMIGWDAAQRLCGRLSSPSYDTWK
jgi:hypothetical protein